MWSDRDAFPVTPGGDCTVFIQGRDANGRVDSRILEERIQEAVRQGCTKIEVQAYGQHGIGGRLWFTGGSH
ncbi:MAG TPA: hypothetical protein PLT69_13570, partial [Deltaproteobacteria bacterium]|nr:hypothetical protein [Deltaproteobacteria bacterium]